MKLWFLSPSPLKNLSFQRAAFCCGAFFLVALSSSSSSPARAVPAPVDVETVPKTEAAKVDTPKNVAEEDKTESEKTEGDAAKVEVQAPKTAEEKARAAQLQEERRRQRNQREAELRELLMGYGITERMPQDEIIRYIAHQTLVNEKLQRKGVELYNALRDTSISEERVDELLVGYRSTLARNRESRQKDEDELNGRINFRAQPRLAALLELAGIIGDGPLNLPPPEKNR